MAPLILHAAQAAREEAERLRNDSKELRLAMRANARAVETRLALVAEASAASRATRTLPTASPWSGLPWLREDESLERILFAVD